MIIDVKSFSIFYSGLLEILGDDLLIPSNTF
jgi:hypothetical protein